MKVNRVHEVNETVLGPALELLPAWMNTPAARAMVLAIGLQESRLAYHLQQGGPAHGLWQFEEAGGCVGVLRHPMTFKLMSKVCKARNVPAAPYALYHALVTDDILAAAAARLLLYTLPEALPRQNEREEGWRQYLEAWRPGKPHRETWDAFYDQAWREVLV